MKSYRIRFAIIRHTIVFIIVSVLCYVYHKNTGRWQIWFFVPVSLLPLLITILHYRTNANEDTEISDSTTQELKKKQ